MAARQYKSVIKASFVAFTAVSRVGATEKACFSLLVYKRQQSFYKETYLFFRCLLLVLKEEETLLVL